MRAFKTWNFLAAAAMAVFIMAPAARAGTVITLDPPGGAISGAPGDTVGWGFALTNGSNWISIDSVTIENETSPLGGASGGFTSYMDLLGGLTNAVTPPGQTWTLPFSPGSPGTGVGQYAIDPGTPLGASDSGDFVIFYDEFSADPNSCGGCYVDTLQLFDANGNAPAFTIDVSASATPEPSAAVLVLIGGAVALLARRRRAPRHCDPARLCGDGRRKRR